jgi:GNAT superfamily N-acetyltransferase
MLKFESAQLQDAKEILELQKLAYMSEAAIYDDYSIPPLKQTLEEIRNQFKDHTFLKATFRGEIVGSVRARNCADGCYIRRLIVHPDFQNQGIGTRLMGEIETVETVPRYEIFTGFRSERNLHLYSKLGYQEFRRERVNERLTLVFLEKYAAAE